MAWSDLNADDLVSFTNIQTSGLSLKSGQSATTSDDIMTKQAATTKYFVDLSVATLAAKNNLDCVARKDLSPGASYSYSVILGNNTGTICGEFSSEVWSSSATYTVGMTLYTELDLINLVTGYSYIVGPDSVIRDLNSTTGVIGSSTFGTC